MLLPASKSVPVSSVKLMRCCDAADGDVLLRWRDVDNRRANGCGDGGRSSVHVAIGGNACRRVVETAEGVAGDAFVGPSVAKQRAAGVGADRIAALAAASGARDDAPAQAEQRHRAGNRG